MLKFALLGLLAKESRHGYDLKRAFERMLGGTWPINIGQIYTTLTRLERDGLVTAETVAQSNVPDRKVYSLTAAGHDALTDWLAEAVEDTVVLKDEMYVKILVHSEVEEGNATELIWRQRQHHLQVLFHTDTWPLARRSGLGPPALQAAGSRTGQVAVLHDRDPALDGGDISGRGLHESRAAGREIRDDLRGLQGEVLGVDDVHV